jgi:peptide/nickel transport system permease protein
MIWFLRGLAISIGLVWVVATIVFMAIHLVPGDPAELLLSQGGVAPDPAAVAELRTQLGLDRPILAQYADSMTRLLRGDLGRSLQDETSVAQEIGRRLPRTLELIGAAMLLAIGLGVPSGAAAAMRRGGLWDRLATGLSGILLAVPVFVLGTVMVFIFAQRLHWVPAGGYVAFTQSPGLHLLLLSMPAAAIGVGLAAVVFRMSRTAVLDVAGRDFVRTARAKGVAPGRIMRHHVLRNALLPVVTIVALHLGSLLGGTVLVEYVFNWPGLSGLLVSAVVARDYPEVVGVVFTISVLFVALNLLVDVLYAVLDPRVRYG